MRLATPSALAVLCGTLPAFAGSVPAAAPAERPLVFEARRGAEDRAFPFVVRGERYAAFVGSAGAVWSAAGRPGLALRFRGASPAAATVPAAPSTSRVLEFRDGAVAARPAFSGLRVASVWPGVDLDWRTEGRDLRYDFTFAAGVDPAVADLVAEGAAALALSPAGDLLVSVPGGVVRHTAPVAWQEDGGLRAAVRASFELRGGARFGFRVEGRDPRLPLVVDPVVRFSALLGGSGDDAARAVAVAADGSVFVAGTTASADFPAKGGPGTAAGGGADAFVAKYAADGTLAFTALLGGSGDDGALSLSLAADGSPWVAGATASSDFPGTGAIQGSLGGGVDGFVAHLSADGTAILFATYLGGAGDDRAAAVGVLPSGEAWVAGTTGSDDFPVTPEAGQPVPGGGIDAFLVRVAADGSALAYATFIGGLGDDGVRALAVDAWGGATLVGGTRSEDFPLLGAPQSPLAGGSDAFALRVDGSGAIAFLTLIGGSGDDEALAVAADAAGNMALGGVTSSPDFPATSLEGAATGGTEGFVASLGSAGSLLSATLLGGSGDDEVRAVALTTKGTIAAAGSTRSADFPVLAAAQAVHGGGADGFLVRLAAGGSSLAWGTFLGGEGDETLDALAVDGPSTAAVAGASGGDALVARLLLVPEAPTSPGFLGLSAVKVTLTWSDPSGGRSSFEIQKRLPGEEWAPLASAPAGTAGWVDGAVLPGTNYEYRMRAVLEGVPSDWTAAFLAGTLPTPPPFAPGTPVLEVLSPTSIALSWEDRSADEIEFQVFRSVDGGAAALVAALPAGTAAWTDGGLTADRTWSYTVRAVGTAGPSSPSAAAAAATPASLSLATTAGKRVDSPKAKRDSIDLSFVVGGLADPRVHGLSVGAGAPGSAPFLSIPAGAEGWKERRGVLTWKSPKGSVAKAVVTVDTATGVVRVRITRTDLAAAGAGPARFWIRSGSDAGSVGAAWAVKKPGTLVLPVP